MPGHDQAHHLADMSENVQGGRIFFSDTGRTFGEEDELCVL